MNRMGATSKRWMSNTADFLNPFNDGKPATKQPHGYQTEAWSNRKPKEEKKRGMFDWMWKEEEENEITSVNEFLAQPMPY
jgi:hypothetical protein